MNTDVLCKLKSLWQEAFHEPMEAIDSFFSTAFSPQRCNYLAEDGVPVSALYWLDCTYEGGKLAYIYTLATDTAHRGKGLASRLMTQTHALLKAQGYAGAVLKPAAGLFPFYQKLGYIPSGYIRRFPAVSGVPVSLQELSPQEFALRRRDYLPPNAVFQEGCTLDFLATFAKFYAAEEALVCAGKYEPVILEYLGNPDSAPGILAALGIDTANIPTIGNDIPFVMFYPINCTKIPGYLGLSLE